jgi:hypothetical protein
MTLQSLNNIDVINDGKVHLNNDRLSVNLLIYSKNPVSSDIEMD